MKSEPVFCNDLFCPCECGAKPSPTAETDGGCWFCGRELIPEQRSEHAASPHGDTTNNASTARPNHLPTISEWLLDLANHPELLDQQARMSHSPDRLLETFRQWKEDGLSYPAIRPKICFYDIGSCNLRVDVIDELVGRTSEFRNGQAEKPAEETKPQTKTEEPNHEK